jgi:hypothetical protein
MWCQPNFVQGTFGAVMGTIWSYRWQLSTFLNFSCSYELETEQNFDILFDADDELMTVFLSLALLVLVSIFVLFTLMYKKERNTLEREISCFGCFRVSDRQFLL